MKLNKMERVAKKGATSFKKRGTSAPPGTILGYAPDWMEKPPKAMSEITSRAQWVSMYWSRAMAQLAAQSVSDVETFQVKDFLLEFLNINRMCIGRTNKLGWT